MTMAEVLTLARRNPDATDNNINEILAFGAIWYPEIYTELEDLEIKIVQKGEYLKGDVLA